MKRIFAACTAALMAVGLAIVGAAAPASAVGLSQVICHATPPATAAQGWLETPPLDANAIITQGHDGHDADIIPVFSTYPGKNLTTLFGWGATGAEILDNGCVLPVQPPPPGPQVVTPPSASMVDECGTANDSIVIPADGTGYSFTGNGGDVYLAPATGYVFPVGTTTEWHFALTDVPCEVAPGELIPPEPDFTDAGCDTPAALSLPAFEHGSWAWGNESGADFSGEPADLAVGVPFAVTAVADAGFVIPGTSVWNFTPVEPADCGGGVLDTVTVVLLPVTMADACGPDNEVVSTPEAQDGVVYSEERSVDGTGTTQIVVTATAEPDFALSYEGAVSDTVTWDFAVNDEACPVVVPDPGTEPPVVVPPVVVPPVVVPPAVTPPVVTPPVVTPPVVTPPAVVPPAAIEPVAVTPPVIVPAVTRPVVLASTGVEGESLGMLALMLFLVGAVVFAVGMRRARLSPTIGDTGSTSRHADDRRPGMRGLWAHRSRGARAGTVHRH